MSQRPLLQLLTAAPRSHLFTRSTRRIAGTHAHVRGRRHFVRTQVNSKQPQSPPQPQTSRQGGSDNAFSGFGAGPSPPRLPEEEQRIYEELQRQSTGAFSTARSPRTPPRSNQSPAASAGERDLANLEVAGRVQKIAQTSSKAEGEGRGEEGEEERLLERRAIDARGDGEELHPNVRRGAQPEFEGDVNPKTGEVGGPKNDPLRWGASGEWTYNGRATDF